MMISAQVFLRPSDTASSINRGALKGYETFVNGTGTRQLTTTKNGIYNGPRSKMPTSSLTYPHEVGIGAWASAAQTNSLNAAHAAAA